MGAGRQNEQQENEQQQEELIEYISKKGPLWRYENACADSASYNDEYIEEYKKYLKGKSVSKDCIAAHVLFSNAWFKNRIEIFTLAGYSSEEIAEEFGVSEGAIIFFKKMFFDIPPASTKILKEYIVSLEDVEEIKEIKIAAVKYGKEYIDYWMFGKPMPQANLDAEYAALQRALLQKIKEIDEVSMGSKEYGHVLRTIDALFYDQIKSKKDGNYSQMAQDVFNDLYMQESTGGKFVAVKDLDLEEQKKENRGKADSQKNKRKKK